IEVEIMPPHPRDIPRVSELSIRTNQFNFTGRRFGEAEVAEIISKKSVFIVRVREKFGDYGTVGFCTYEVSKDVLFVESLVLSCRALGRSVEERIVEQLGKIASLSGCSELRLSYV